MIPGNANVSTLLLSRIGIVFSLMLGLAFLFMGLMPGAKTAALSLFWGSILTVTRQDLIFLAVTTAAIVGLAVTFYKEIQATVFNRDMALAVGVSATFFLYGILFLTGATITVTLGSMGGLLIFSLILNPAAAAYQLTYSMTRMFLLSAVFGVVSSLTGLLLSYIFDVPSGATIVVTSSVIFLLAAVFSPKRKVKTGPKGLLKGESGN